MLQVLSSLSKVSQQGAGNGDGGGASGQGAGQSGSGGQGQAGGGSGSGEGALPASLVAKEALLLRQAQDEFAQELEANLARLREVIKETQTIAQKMEVALGKDSGGEQAGSSGEKASSRGQGKGAPRQ